jgi:hypothetical protein
MQKSPIFLSYPKSGRTWVRFMLDRAGLPMDYSHAGTGSRRHALGTPFHAVNPDKYAGRRTVFMYRNPIDTTVSFYFQVHRRELIPWTPRYFARLLPYLAAGRWPPKDLKRFIRHPGYGVEKVCKFNRAWLDHLANRPDALILTYEELMADGKATMARLLEFLGADSARAGELVDYGRFENMQRVETTDPKGRNLAPGIEGDPESLKVRRGKVRGYVDYLDEETIALCRATAARYGFTV